jgi:hypothetical protein
LTSHPSCHPPCSLRREDTPNGSGGAPGALGLTPGGLEALLGSGSAAGGARGSLGRGSSRTTSASHSSLGRESEREGLGTGRWAEARGERTGTFVACN